MATKKKKAVVKKVSKKSQSPALLTPHKHGDRYVVNDVFCEIKYLNAGSGWLFPLVDDMEDPAVRRHMAYGKIDDTGKVSRL